MSIKYTALPLALIVMVGACKEETTSNIPAATQTESAAAQAKSLNAEEVTKRLKASGLPIDGIIVVTEETDDNKLLGRPNQYISKTYFIDTRHEGEGLEPDEQNTVEVFASDDDAKSRREYVERVTKDMPMFTQYIIQKGPVVVRLDKALTASEAKQYEDALSE